MSGELSEHRHTWDQIPWIVNDSLPDAERLLAEAHLHSCADCREELEFQRRLAMSMQRDDSENVDPQRSWQQLRARIEARPLERSPVSLTDAPLQLRARSFSWTPWLAAAMVVQALGLGALGAALWSRPANPRPAQPAVYRTLSAADTSADGATIRVVFAPDTRVARMQALLDEAGLQVRSGPSSAGVWSLEPAQTARTDTQSARQSATDTQSALQRLRGNPEVRFAEALGGAP